MAASAASVDPLAYIETRIGTAPSETLSAGIFGKKTEEFGQCLPAVLVPHGMNFWTPQTRDTEKKCVAPYYYRDSLLQGFRNSHWIVGGCTQDYGSMTLMPLSGTLRLTPQVRASRVSHDNVVSTPAYYRNRLIDENITAEMTGTSRAGIFRFTYDNGGDAYVVVNPNSDEAQGFVEVDPEHRQIRGYNPVHRIYQGKGEPAGFAGYFVVQFDRAPSAWGTGQGDNVRQGDAADAVIGEGGAGESIAHLRGVGIDAGVVTVGEEGRGEERGRPLRLWPPGGAQREHPSHGRAFRLAVVQCGVGAGDERPPG